jgi:short-subunit dehydrogenase
VVVANAGFGVGGRVDSLALADYRRQFETNVFGVLRTIYATLGDLKKTKGRLAVVGSVSGFFAVPSVSAYCMSKFAVRALCESLADELHGSGVSVTHIAPGFVESEINRVDRMGVFHPRAADRSPAKLRVPVDHAARDIVHAIHRRKRQAVITKHGKLLVFLSRHTPWALSPFARKWGKSRAARGEE